MESEEILFIDGSYGEGGGQILRSALSLSLLLQKPFRMINIRSGRQKPGLQTQHLTAVKACAEISSAKVKGAEMGSQEIEFYPGKIKSGKLKFDTGTAASTTLILQCIAPALIFGEKNSTIEIKGGTNNPMAPSVLYFQNIFLPIMKKIGVNLDVAVDEYGWYPKGQGILHSEIKISEKIFPLQIIDRGNITKLEGVALISNLPRHIAEREKKQLLKNVLDLEFKIEPKIEIKQAPSVGLGTELFLCAEYESSLAGFSSLGEIGKPAEKLADEVCKEFVDFHETKTIFDPHASDQILLYLSLAKGKSTFTTSRISNHLVANTWLIKQFLPDVIITIDGKKDEKGKITIEGIDFERD